MSFIDLHTNVSLGHTKITGLGGEKLWLCPTLGGDKLDISGNGNHGTYYGGMGTVALSGSGGTRAYDFDGTNDRIDCPADTLGGSSTISMCCWVYQDSHDSLHGQGFMGQTGNVANSDKTALLWSPASGSGKAVRCLIHTNTSGSFAEAYWGSPPPPLNAWHHWCMTADGSTIKLHKDGILVDSTVYSGSPPTSPTIAFEIGRYIGNPTSPNLFCLDGKMDDVRVFHRALSTSEITHLASKRGVLGTPRNPVIKKRRIFYAPTAPPTTTAKAVVLKKPKPSYATGYARNASESANPNLWKGLVGAWMPSFGVTGGTLKDVSGNGNDGTLTNMDAASDWVVTQKGTALYFDNSSHKVSYQTNFQSAFQNSFTFSCLVKFNAADDRDAIFGNYNASSGWLNFERHTSNRLRHVYVNGSSVVDDYSPNNSVSAGWNFVNFTRQRISSTQSRLIYHVDGKEVRNASISYVDRTVTWPNFFLGADTRNIFTNLNGNIAFASIYNRALSPSEIKQLYLNPAAPFERKQQTVGLSTAQAFNPYWANQATQLAGTLQ